MVSGRGVPRHPRRQTRSWAGRVRGQTRSARVAPSATLPPSASRVDRRCADGRGGRGRGRRGQHRPRRASRRRSSSRTVAAPAAAQNNPGGRRRQRQPPRAARRPCPPSGHQREGHRSARGRRARDGHRPIDREGHRGRVVAGSDEGQRRDEPDVRRPGIAAAALGAEVVPISRSAGGAIGIAAMAPPVSCRRADLPEARRPRARAEGRRAGRPSDGRSVRSRSGDCSSPSRAPRRVRVSRPAAA